MCLCFSLAEVIMRKRFKMSKKHSKRSFTRHAVRVNGRNAGSGYAMRGGIRL